MFSLQLAYLASVSHGCRRRRNGNDFQAWRSVVLGRCQNFRSIMPPPPMLALAALEWPALLRLGTLANDSIKLFASRVLYAQRHAIHRHAPLGFLRCCGLLSAARSTLLRSTAFSAPTPSKNSSSRRRHSPSVFPMLAAARIVTSRAQQQHQGRPAARGYTLLSQGVLPGQVSQRSTTAFAAWTIGASLRRSARSRLISSAAEFMAAPKTSRLHLTFYIQWI